MKQEENLILLNDGHYLPRKASFLPEGGAKRIAKKVIRYEILLPLKEDVISSKEENLFANENCFFSATIPKDTKPEELREVLSSAKNLPHSRLDLVRFPRSLLEVNGLYEEFEACWKEGLFASLGLEGFRLEDFKKLYPRRKALPALNLLTEEEEEERLLSYMDIYGILLETKERDGAMLSIHKRANKKKDK